MYEQSLMLAGLTREQSIAYELLVKYGSLSASDLAKKGGLSSRPLAYKVLDGLIALGLAERKEVAGKVARFVPAHPMKLREHVAKEKERVEGAALALEGVVGKLVSDYNLVSGKPGVRFFEGKEGMKAILADSLGARSEIYTYADIEAIAKYIPKENEEYVRQREKFGIKKKGILLDTPFARSFMADYHRDVTDFKLIAHRDAKTFQTVMQIYDGKITYQTLGENMIGAIVEDPHIFAMHKYLFEYLWQITPEFRRVERAVSEAE